MKNTSSNHYICEVLAPGTYPIVVRADGELQLLKEKIHPSQQISIAELLIEQMASKLNLPASRFEKRLLIRQKNLQTSAPGNSLHAKIAIGVFFNGSNRDAQRCTKYFKKTLQGGLGKAISKLRASLKSNQPQTEMIFEKIPSSTCIESIETDTSKSAITLTRPNDSEASTGDSKPSSDMEEVCNGLALTLSNQLGGQVLDSEISAAGTDPVKIAGEVPIVQRGSHRIGELRLVGTLDAINKSPAVIKIRESFPYSGRRKILHEVEYEYDEQLAKLFGMSFVLPPHQRIAFTVSAVDEKTRSCATEKNKLISFEIIDGLSDALG